MKLNKALRAKFPFMRITQGTEMIKSAAIIDLDNCIANDQWRLNLIQHHHEVPNDRYWDYHDRCDLDDHPNPHVIFNLTRRVDHLIVFTSRPEKVRLKTSQWLSRWGIPISHLMMRPDDNMMPSVDIKKLMLNWLPAEYEVQYAIDDRNDILDMYRANGIRSVERVFIYEPEIIHP